MTGAGRRRKGHRVEREVRKFLERYGLQVKKVPLSGQTEDYPDDLIIEGWSAEVKARATSRWKVLEEWKGDATILIVKADRGKPYAFVDLCWLAEVLLDVKLLCADLRKVAQEKEQKGE